MTKDDIKRMEHVGDAVGYVTRVDSDMADVLELKERVARALSCALETLTDEERRWLMNAHECEGWGAEEKALRIIDAQAARIAELETKVSGTCLQCADIAKAANARAEAAERQLDLDQTFKTYSNFERRLNEHASQLTQLECDIKRLEERKALEQNESDEIASLRAEVDEKLAALDSYAETILELRAEVKRVSAHAKFASDEHSKADAECEDLRAEVERLTEQSTTFRVECERLESRLAAATELLGRCRMAIGGQLGADTVAFLTNAQSDGGALAWDSSSEPKRPREEP